MKKRKTDKSYVYERDGKACVYCGKSLAYRQMSLDHYFPRGSGGPDDLFNLALSCKSCNKHKKNKIPPDWEHRLVGEFKRGVADQKILAAGIKIKRGDLKELAAGVDRLKHLGPISVFQSLTHAFHVRQNKIIKIVPIQR